MDKKENKDVFGIALACALGAGFGTLIALSIAFNFFWIGLLAGGLIGYLSVGFKNVVTSVSVAWRAVAGYKIDKKRQLMKLSAFCTIHLWAIFVLYGILIIKHDVLPNYKTLLVIHPFLFIFSICLPILIASLVSSSKQERYDAYRNITMRYSPLIILPLAIPVALFYLVVYSGDAIKFVSGLFCSVGKFIWILFKLIHSDIRYICGIDSLLGATVGFLAGMNFSGPLIIFVGIGSGAGAVFGVVNYVLVRNVLLRKYFADAV